MSNYPITSYLPHVQEQIRRKLLQQLPAGARTEGGNMASHAEGKQSLISTGPGTEAELQDACEKCLVRFGFHRLTPRNIVNFAAVDHAGWFMHLVDARRECCLPDLLIFDRAMTRCLCMELKASDKVKKSKAQKAMFTNGIWRIAYDVDKFAADVAGWRGKE